MSRGNFMNSVIIEIDQVTMKFRVTSEKVRNLKEYLLKTIKRNLRHSEFYALKSISFAVQSGDRVGIIGKNGAGKSTLLKIIAGVLKPTEGTVTVHGRVAPLLELGVGFDPELTGAENIYLNGALLGKSKKFLDDKFQEIVDFSELGNFIHVPVKNYSSGMRARLGFSIATQVDPDILIVDEILGVGDASFRKKSSAKMAELIEAGKTVLLVSHQIGMIKSFTNKALWLHQGEMKAFGPTEEVCGLYEEFLKNK